MIMPIRTVCSRESLPRFIGCAAAEPPWMGLRRVLMDIIIDRRHDMDLVLQYKCIHIEGISQTL